jgi:hypothetical protein
MPFIRLHKKIIFLYFLIKNKNLLCNKSFIIDVMKKQQSRFGKIYFFFTTPSGITTFPKTSFSTWPMAL